ncbi:proteasome assembly chaperone 2 [Orussus abietinus]|uniref:proteasome assembly chaperone 2 n=1 Tax=Orussus abietinus TaxID=222816 RepID=UPI00062698E1|nr:proteasome assembly chaperone 2 [Orussus abietinus]XP_012281674.1 proteasome assembly chaperone 2 [Orussus abietinus]
MMLHENINMKGYTLILPSVSTGNVGQLTVDLLISSLNLKKTGQCIVKSFIPIVGPDPYDEKSPELCTAIDLFIEPKKKIAVLQIRSPRVISSTEIFATLKSFINKNEISKVIILASSYSHEMKDVQLQGSHLRYLACSSTLKKNKSTFDNMNWIELEPKVDEKNNATITRIPGGGFAKVLYDNLCKASIESTILIKFCSEGDNILDALALLSYLNQWVCLIELKNNGIERRVKYPLSWKMLFGNLPPCEIY